MTSLPSSQLRTADLAVPALGWAGCGLHKHPKHLSRYGIRTFVTEIYEVSSE